MTIGEPCWIHLFTGDIDGAVTFYGGLFDWSVGEPSEEYGGYRMFLRGDEPIAGLMPNDTSNPDVWEVFLQTPDIAATVERARARGAVIATDVMQVADLGLDDQPGRPGRRTRRAPGSRSPSRASGPVPPSGHPGGSRR